MLQPTTNQIGQEIVTVCESLYVELKLCINSTLRTKYAGQSQVFFANINSVELAKLTVAVRLQLLVNNFTE